MTKPRVLSISFGSYKSGEIRGVPSFIINRWEKLRESNRVDCDFLTIRLTSKPLFSQVGKQKKLFLVSGSKIYSYYVQQHINPLFSYFCRPQSFHPEIQKHVMQQTFRNIQSIVDLQSYEILHFHQILPYSLIGLFAKKKFGNIVVLSAHGHGVHTYPSQSLKYEESTVNVLRNVDHVIFVSKYLKDKASLIGYDSQDFSIVNNGFDPHAFKKMRKFDVSSRLNLPSNRMYLGYIGVLSETKGTDHLINIFKMLFKKFGEEICFIVIGEGPYSNLVKNLIRDIPLIYLKSVPHDQVPLWLNLLDIFILPSKEEGFSCIALESLACETWLVGSKILGISEVIRDAGGVLVERDDSFDANVVNIISRYVGNEIPRNSSDIKFLKEHHWEYIVDKEIQIYENLILKRDFLER